MKKILSLCVALLAATQMFASFVPKFGENGAQLNSSVFGAWLR